MLIRVVVGPESYRDFHKGLQTLDLGRFTCGNVPKVRAVWCVDAFLARKVDARTLHDPEIPGDDYGSLVSSSHASLCHVK